MGGIAVNRLESHAQEPKWTPHPYQGSVAPPEARTSQKKVSSTNDEVELAPVQRWRKTEATGRLTRSAPPTTQVATQIAINPPTGRESISSVEPVRSRNSVVAVKWSPDEDSNQESNAPSEPVRLKTKPIEKRKLVHQDTADPKPSDPPAIPNPFPRTKTLDESPSDPRSQLLLEQNATDLPPAPPADIRRASINCDVARDFIDNLDIRRVRVDSSPLFAEGYPSQDRANTNTKESFVAGAPTRTWYSISGQEVARGKLVDMVFDSAVIEKPDGSKTTILLRKLSDPDQVYVSEAWGVPVTCSLGDQEVAERMFADSVLTWKASGLCHKPLYFEDVQLERYGHEVGPIVQPALSTVRFFGDLAVLPYKMGIHPPNECQYSLGYYRPGECAPWTRGPVPISLRGALSQAAFVTGTAWVLP